MLQRAFAQDASKIKELLELVSNQLQTSKIKILTAKENSWIIYVVVSNQLKQFTQVGWILSTGI